ncbi:unnamed protein product [Schistocephalus solidus]|uniref:Uncharacterized protein n=1 Tax=Schistocephalus solidus TaxID=70667 RepID=A0A183TEL9_SCHSO|nr:unnamed protein product [Schistocephalus solidus]
MGLFSHMRIHDSGIHRNADNTDTPSTPSAPAILTTTATTTTRNDLPQPLLISLAHTAPATSTHAMAWSVTCKSIARRLVNQCLGLRHAVAAPASTALTAPAHLHTARAYSDTCASTKTCGKPPEAKPHQRTPYTLIHRQQPYHHHVPEYIMVS